jgi:hypothetical protein
MINIDIYIDIDVDFEFKFFVTSTSTSSYNSLIIPVTSAGRPAVRPNATPLTRTPPPATYMYTYIDTSIRVAAQLQQQLPIS